jgi:hypothetical protein
MQTYHRPPEKQAQNETRRFPTDRQLRALELGADELHNRLEWSLRDRPRALRNARLRYRQFCISLVRTLENNSRPRLERAA